MSTVAWSALAGGAAVAAAWRGVPTVPIAAALVFAFVVAAGGSFRHAGVAALVVVLAGWRADHEWAALVPTVGPYEGWVRVVDDPQPASGATRVIVEVDERRYEVWARGRARRIRVSQWRGGDLVRVSGVRRAVAPSRLDRIAWQHVVGELQLEWVADTAPGNAADRASNRVRAMVETAAGELPGADGPLYRGLVIGDDRDQPVEMIQRFRASGLSHLTAVSGQNVSFVLAAAGPLLRRLRPWPRWLITLVLVAWFVSLTRFEPSIVRAGMMAALSATGFLTGRERSPMRLLAVAVTVLLVVDPLLVRSVGFWLSVGATAGVAGPGPWLGERLGRRVGRLGLPLGVTLGAQLGVIVPALIVFGRLPVVSIPANLAAVPVAGFVMLFGLPAGLIAAAVPPLAPVLMFPCRLGVRWVDTVALVAARLEPGGRATWVGWVIVTGLTLAALRRGRRKVRIDGAWRSTS